MRRIPEAASRNRRFRPYSRRLLLLDSQRERLRKIDRKPPTAESAVGTSAKPVSSQWVVFWNICRYANGFFIAYLHRQSYHVFSRKNELTHNYCKYLFCFNRVLLSLSLQAAHINTQTGGDNFVCQWQGCKVQGRTSCSRRWLERHVLSHGGNKPFRCIVDGCGCRFSSQVRRAPVLTA
jgi:hypothetical protein